MDLIVLDTQPMEFKSSKHHIPIILGRPFLTTTNAIIHCSNELLNLSFGNITLETNFFTVGKQLPKVDQIEEVNFIESIIQEHGVYDFKEDPIERALVWSESNDQLEFECIYLHGIRPIMYTHHINGKMKSGMTNID